MIDGDVSTGLSKTGALSRSNPLDVSGELLSGDKAFSKVSKKLAHFRSLAQLLRTQPLV
jgi:hypothetical protein